MTENNRNATKCMFPDCQDIVISCGTKRGILHTSRFVCPGIHQDCIEVESGTLTTPKSFSILGDKGKLKDWKNALRIKGKSIRRMMDSGQLTFYRHYEQCTGRCMAGKVGTPKPDLPQNVPVPCTLNQPNIQEREPIIRGHQDVICIVPSSRQDDLYPPSTTIDTQVPHNIVDGTEPVTIKTETPDILVNQNDNLTIPQCTPSLVYNNSNVEQAFDRVDDISLEEGEILMKALIDIGCTGLIFKNLHQRLAVLQDDILNNQTSRNNATYQQLFKIISSLNLTLDMKMLLAEQKFIINQQSHQLQTEMEKLRAELSKRENKCVELEKKSTCIEQIRQAKKQKTNH